MYSRNQGREQKRRDFDSAELYDDVSDEEYEIYKYNLPPKYDGSRFRRIRQRERRVEIESPAEPEAVVSESAVELNIENEDPKDVEECCEAKAQNPKTEEGLQIENLPQKADKQKFLPRIFSGIGYEEILIIALILAISGGEDNGEVILLLALLLTQK